MKTPIYPTRLQLNKPLIFKHKFFEIPFLSTFVNITFIRTNFNFIMPLFLNFFNIVVEL
jgi:hypothetical protein